MKRAFFAAILVVATAFSASAERRVALVLAADNYRTVRPLQNAGNDGVAVKLALEALDFEVFVETDRDLRRMRRALDDFREDAKDADVALVFFAGHGVEIAGENRLLPIDADASSLDAIKASSLPLEEVRAAVAEVGKIGLVLLDACRNEPFGMSVAGDRGVVAKKFESSLRAQVKPGLGRVGRAENILFAFAAAPGETASDGAGWNSPFTAALVKYLGTEGLEIRSVLTLVQQEVYDLSRGRQLPYVESGLPRLFFAAADDTQLPERERLLLAMANITPSIRTQIERIAVEREMPLAPLYGALISSGATALSTEDREQQLIKAAGAFVEVRDEMRKLAANDPRVARLRLEAEEQLSLGAFDTARDKLADAANIDAVARRALKENFVGRTLSEAATVYLSGGAARADLRYELAIADYEQAAALFAEVDGEDIPAKDRLQQIRTVETLGDMHILVGNLAKANLAYEERQRISVRSALNDPGNTEWQHILSVGHDRIGDIRLAQGNLPGALEAFTASLDITARLAAADPSNAGRQHDRSVGHNRIGDIRMAQGNLPGALEAFTASLDTRARLAAADPGNAGWQRDLSVSHNKIGEVRVAQGNLSGALGAFHTGLDIAARLAAADPSNDEWQRDLSVSHNKIGEVQVALGNLSRALEAFQTSLDIAERLAAADPANAGWQRDLSVSHGKIGDVRMAQGNLSGALESFQAGLDIASRLAAVDPGNAGWQRDLSISHSKIGNVRMVQGNLGGAHEAFQTSLNIAARLAATDPGNAGWQRDLSVSHGKIGDVRMAQGNLSGALESFQAGLDIASRLAAADPGNAGWQRDLSVGHNRMGDVQIARGDLAGALEAFRAGLDIRTRLATAHPENTGWHRDLIVSHFKIAQAGGDAKIHLRKALEVAEELERSGKLAPSDGFIPGMLRTEIGKLEEVAK